MVRRRGSQEKSEGQEKRQHYSFFYLSHTAAHDLSVPFLPYQVDSVFSVRMMARAGFPWLCVDMEHAAIDWSLASTLFGFIAEEGSVPLCRVPNGTHENIKRALDAGAWGIVAPMVDTVGFLIALPHISTN